MLQDEGVHPGPRHCHWPELPHGWAKVPPETTQTDVGEVVAKLPRGPAHPEQVA